MRRYPLSTELVQQLKKHQFVLRASTWSVTFTEEFKEQAYEEYCKGKPMKEIFTEAGFDVEALGSKRIENFSTGLTRRANSEADIEDKRNTPKTKNSPSTEAQLLKRIRELEHRTIYLEQENSFLKKIQKLEKGYAGRMVKQK